MRINRDFFGFPEKDLRPYAQPYYKKNSFDIHTNHIVPDDEFNGDDDDDDVRNRRLSTTTTTTTTTTSTPRHWLPRKPIHNLKQQLPNYNDNRNIENDDEHSDRTNSIQYDFTTHLRRLKIEDVRDFTQIKSNHIRQTDSSSSSAMLAPSSSSSSTSSTSKLKPCTQMITYLIIIVIINIS